MAYPIGGPGTARFLVMEMHYDNPDMRSGTYVNGVLDNKDTTCFVWCEGRLNYDSSDVPQIVRLIPMSSFQLEPKDEANFCFVELEKYPQTFEVIHVRFYSSIAFVQIAKFLCYHT